MGRKGEAVVKYDVRSGCESFDVLYHAELIESILARFPFLYLEKASRLKPVDFKL